MMLKSKSGSAYFERGSAVKISIQNDNGCSWVSGTVLRRFSSRRFLVVITDEQSRKRTRKFVSLHRLRPLLPRQIYLPKLKSSGDNRDCISELPDTVLLHIMSFMDTKDAVRTCVLSKRWKNLCKRLTCLAFSSVHRHKRRLKMCKKFASWVLTSRDSSHSLFNLTIDNWFDTEVVLLDRVMEYAMCHDVQHLTMLQLNSSSEKPFEIVTLSSISYCQTLTSLKLCFDEKSTMIRLPKTLHLPALKSLHLQHIYFTADDNGCAEPFSNCNVLSTLFICNRYWLSDYVLCISNLTLSRLTLQGFEFRQNCQIVLSTPCLSSCNINGLHGLKLSSTCNLSFIEQVNIDMRGRSDSRIMSCLQLFVNVKILTLTPPTLYGILYEYFLSPSRPAQPPHPPHFVRLESFKVENAKWPGRLSDWAVDKTLAYLLQNSQCPNRVVIHLATRRPQ